MGGQIEGSDCLNNARIRSGNGMDRGLDVGQESGPSGTRAATLPSPNYLFIWLSNIVMEGFCQESGVIFVIFRFIVFRFVICRKQRCCVDFINIGKMCGLSIFLLVYPVLLKIFFFGIVRKRTKGCNNKNLYE